MADQTNRVFLNQIWGPILQFIAIIQIWFRYDRIWYNPIYPQQCDFLPRGLPEKPQFDFFRPGVSAWSRGLRARVKPPRLQPSFAVGWRATGAPCWRLPSATRDVTTSRLSVEKMGDGKRLIWKPVETTRAVQGFEDFRMRNSDVLGFHFGFMGEAAKRWVGEAVKMHRFYTGKLFLLVTMVYYRLSIDFPNQSIDKLDLLSSWDLRWWSRQQLHGFGVRVLRMGLCSAKEPYSLEPWCGRDHKVN